MSQGSSENDIWEYKSLKRKKRRNKSPNTDEHGTKIQRHAKQSSPKTSDGVTKFSKTRSSVQTDTTETSYSRNVPNKPVQAQDSVTHQINHGASSEGDPEKDLKTEEYCPVCQMPFSVLLVQSQRWHVAECLDTPGETNEECPNGLLCSSSIPSHYKRFSHSLLAHSRAINGPVNLPSTLDHTARLHLEEKAVTGDSTNSSKDTSLDSAVNLSSVSSQSASPAQGSRVLHTPVRTNALLLLRSPAPEDIKKKKGWSPSTKVSTSKKLSFRISTPVKAGNVGHAVQVGEIKEEPCVLNDDDDYISYSPLSELPAEVEGSQANKEWFASTEGVCKEEENDERDSLILFNDTVMSDDELFSDVLDQYETETSSQGDPLLKESAHTCDQLRPSEHLVNSRAAAGVLSQFSSPVRPSAENHLEKNGDGSSAETQLQSSQSLVLERLRERISKPAHFSHFGSDGADVSCAYKKQETHETAMSSSQTQAFPACSGKGQSRSGASGLKQTDIGVFFGLKPLKEKATEKAGTEDKSWGNFAPGKSREGAGGNAKRQGRRQRKSTAPSEVPATAEETEEGAAQPTQAEGGRRVRAGGRKRWNRGRTTDGGSEEPKRCPFYKRIPGTGFAVDAFRYGTIQGITAYFLTHFHSDHYEGLNKNSTFPIYCNKITANLVKRKLRVDEQHIHVLPMNTECTVDGVTVVLMDANHCPGAAMFLFRLPDGQTVLHTGDFRADPSMERYPELQGFRVQTLYLDTTYCSPEYAFPTQQEVITFAANTAFEMVTLNPRTLVVCGTYSVGKEKVFLAISQVLGSKVYVSRDRHATMCCLESEQISQCVTTNQNAARVHVLPMMQINFKNLKAHLNKFSGTYDQLVAFKPTGWTFSQSVGVENIQPQVKDNISIYGVPYSEHSSYLELRRFVQWLRPLKIIPTVNVGSGDNRRFMEQSFSQWQAEVRGLCAETWSTSTGSYTRQ
ncbi:DNA cross-link repair 1A protein [Brachyhypopomus gauderio]|uniref:DNA cross-link repair 1A protein n=1 Tax=Brachyhypopomus gauderio TaxID=698409 RepID=UPI004042D753